MVVCLLPLFSSHTCLGFPTLFKASLSLSQIFKFSPLKLVSFVVVLLAERKTKDDDDDE